MFRGREIAPNIVFCEWVLYDGTAPEQKTKNAQNTNRLDACEYFHFIGRSKPLPYKITYLYNEFYIFLCVVLGNLSFSKQ